MIDRAFAEAVAGYLAEGVPSLVDDPIVARLSEALHARFGAETCALVLYGSYLRGARDTLLDFYVVVEDYGRAFGSRAAALGAYLMPPNVYQLAVTTHDQELRAKYAVVSRRQLQRQVRALHPYFWARLTQPCQLVWVRDASARAALHRALADSVDTFVRRVAPMMRGAFTAAEFWQRGFALTYRAELRAERGGRVTTLFEHDKAHYTTLLDLCASMGAVLRAQDQHTYANVRERWMGFRRAQWAGTIALGKVLSVARLVKAAVTFNDAIDYMLWKIERHSGIRLEATERQRRYPLIFAWPLAWRLYRMGAFR